MCAPITSEYTWHLVENAANLGFSGIDRRTRIL